MRSRRGWRLSGGLIVSARGQTLLRRRFRALGISTIVIAFTMVFGWGWRVRAITVTGTALVPDGAVRDTAFAWLRESRGGVFPRSHMLSSAPWQLAMVLRTHYAFLAVDIRRQWGNRTLSIIVREFPIAAVAWTPNGEGALLNRAGSVIGHLPPGGDPQRVPLHAPHVQLGSPIPPIGKALLQEDAVATLALFWEDLRSTGGTFTPKIITTLPGVERSFDIRTVGGQTIRVSTEELAVQRDKLQAFLRNRQTAGERAALRIVDLRYGDRVYVQ